jgi:glutamate racemase
MKPPLLLNNNQSIGVFDSGLGGLTVLRSLEKQLPNESFIYFGDTAHVPYGSKSDKTVQNYSNKITQFLLDHDVKLIVIACNTVSSVATPLLQEKFNIPIFGVVTPSVEQAIAHHNGGEIGIIGTQSTITSKSYIEKFTNLAPHIKTFQQACPLFVPLIEENWGNTNTAKEIASIYLEPFLKHPIDALVLGCTHYPIMEPVIQSVMGDSVNLISSGPAVAKTVAFFLTKNKLQNDGNDSPNEAFFVTDFPQKFDELGSQFLGRTLTNVHYIKL